MKGHFRFPPLLHSGRTGHLSHLNNHTGMFIFASENVQIHVSDRQERAKKKSFSADDLAQNFGKLGKDRFPPLLHSGRTGQGEGGGEGGSLNPY